VEAAERMRPLDDVALDEVDTELAQDIERRLILYLLRDHEEVEAP
jgi:hypothetical protein